MEKGWVKVFTAKELYRASLLKGVLEDEGIDVIILNKKDSIYITIGEVELYVKQSDAVRALNIIQKNEA